MPRVSGRPAPACVSPAAIALTGLGRSLPAPLDAACAWTRTHAPEITEARAACEQAAL
ncbi:hypothetical protein [Streptomyces sp. NPDC004266]|uniref:hypothetical protein n=1 Tax=Streptomyces sp. NPDC004266 TaxID=3364693 RepID=UPI0036C30469